MPTMHLGVLEMPYSHGGTTTFQVAQFLEARYGLMDAFVAIHGPVIQHDIENSIRGAIESMWMGGPKVDAVGSLSSAMSAIEDTFREAIDMQSYDHKLPGVPTKAAQMGIKHSKKKARTGSPRPSFFDTGLFSTSFRAWVTS